ncbi:MAG: hypothetical protein AB1531_07590 [Chloroflexota bacterium]
MNTFLILAFFLFQAVTPAIVSPGPGAALQGMVTITGTSDAIGFVSYELAFAYPNDPTGTWFLIAQSNQAVQNGILAEWDTTAITDGNYTLRLLVILDNGTSLEVRVPDLRVRNYTPVETPTPGPTRAPATESLPAATPSIPLPTLIPLPANPAVLTASRILSSLGYGAVAAASVLLVLSLYLRLRKSGN